MKARIIWIYLLPRLRYDLILELAQRVKLRK